MLIEIYLFLYSVSFLFFLLMFFKDEKYIFGPVSMIFFFVMAFLSGDVDLHYCAITSADAYSCYTATEHYPELMWINAGIGVISLIYTIGFTLYDLGKLGGFKK